MNPRHKVLLLVLVGIRSVTALSWPACDTTDMAWTTDTPRLTGQYPFASLLSALPFPSMCANALKILFSMVLCEASRL